MIFKNYNSAIPASSSILSPDVYSSTDIYSSSDRYSSPDMYSSSSSQSDQQPTPIYKDKSNLPHSTAIVMKKSDIRLTIDFPLTANQYTIYTVHGKLVTKGNKHNNKSTHSIDMIPPGVYIIRYH